MLTADQYVNVGSTRNGHEPHYPDGYSTDLVSKMGMGFLDEALEEPKNPFFLTLAPIAPHVYWSGRTRMGGPPHPAPRHRDMFKDEKVLRAKNFNPDSPSGVSWVYDLLKLDDAEVEKLDKHHVKRLQSLQAVDDMVGDMIDRLNEAGVLDNTYFIYTSDNGFHLGHHRLKAGKELGFETDINVPFVIRGPGIPEGDKRYSPTTHTDIAPTIMKLAGNDINDKEFDGLPMDLWEDSGSGRVEHVAVEFWAAKFKDEPRNTYKGLRIEAEKYGFYYAVWCTNEKELYDMKVSCHDLSKDQIPIKGRLERLRPD